jgi:hypothetical protein
MFTPKTNPIMVSDLNFIYHHHTSIEFYNSFHFRRDTTIASSTVPTLRVINQANPYIPVSTQPRVMYGLPISQTPPKNERGKFVVNQTKPDPRHPNPVFTPLQRSATCISLSI